MGGVRDPQARWPVRSPLDAGGARPPVGSNIFNILGIPDIAGLISPIDVAAHVIHFDMPVAILAALVCFPVVLRRGRISRHSGLLPVLGYIVYCTLLYMRAGP